LKKSNLNKLQIILHSMVKFSRTSVKKTILKENLLKIFGLIWCKIETNPAFITIYDHPLYICFPNVFYHLSLNIDGDNLLLVSSICQVSEDLLKYNVWWEQRHCRKPTLQHTPESTNNLFSRRLHCVVTSDNNWRQICTEVLSSREHK